MEAGTIIGIIISLFIIIFIILFLSTSIKVVRFTDEMIVERLGTYRSTWSHGVKFKMPFIDRIVAKVSLKEQVLDCEPQAVITKDNVTMEIDTVVYYKVADTKNYVYGVNNPTGAIQNLISTTLRNLIGELELDSTLTSRDQINTNLRNILDLATNSWGIKINRVEVKNILPPHEVRTSMEKQMKAEREKRASILESEGKKQSAILQAQGERESSIIRAEGQKQSAIIEAEGISESILIKNRAEVKAIENISLIKPTKEAIEYRKYEALERVANSSNSKLIVPSELSSLVTISEVLNKKNN